MGLSFPSMRARGEDAVFRVLGEDAAWSGIDPTVRIRYRQKDEDSRLAHGQVVQRAAFVRVRKIEVTAPAIGDQVTRMESGEILVVIGEPLIDEKDVWECEVAPA